MTIFTVIIVLIIFNEIKLLLMIFINTVNSDLAEMKTIINT